MAERTTASKKRNERKTRPTLARQQIQKPISQPLMAPRAEIQLQLHDTIAACEGLGERRI